MREGQKKLGKCFGTTTVSERGQIVIPAEARRTLGITCGTKLVVFQSGGMAGNALVLMAASTVTDYVQQTMGRLAELERTVMETAEESDQ
jgi:AbrB family looped-hinge helix DNA binding protein